MDNSKNYVLLKRNEIMQFADLIYTPQNKIFQYFLTMLGQMVHANLVRQNEYLKVENEILRSKLGKQIRTTYQEKLKIIRYGLAVGGPIKKIVSIVSYQTFRKWVNALEDGNLRKNVLSGTTIHHIIFFHLYNFLLTLE